MKMIRMLVSTAVLALPFALGALGQTVPAAALENPPSNPAVEAPLADTVFFFGASADPNGALADVSADVGGAKLVTGSTYLGIVAHLSKGTTPGARLNTKVTPHVAQKLLRFRQSILFWTAAGGLDILSQQTPATPAALVTNYGYTVGSGPLVSIPVGRTQTTYVQLHAEVTKGSVQDLGWRGGVLLAFGNR